MLPRTPRSVLSTSSAILRGQTPVRTASVQLRLLQSQSKRQQQCQIRPSLQLQLPRRTFHSTPVAGNTNSNNVAGAGVHVKEATPLANTEYHEYSEHYFEVLLGELEKRQENGSDVEAEYSAGVLNIVVPGVGTYVLNKQPPNKQIWLSSPISGPKRYDWVVDGKDKKSAIRQWVYLRDGSNLTDLLNEELSLSLPRDVYSGMEYPS